MFDYAVGDVGVGEGGGWMEVLKKARTKDNERVSGRDNW